MPMKRRAAALIAVVFTIGGVNVTTARADIGGGPNGGGGGGSDSCGFGAMTVSKGGGTEVSTSVTCSSTSSTSTTGTPGVYDWTPPKCWWEPITEGAFIKAYSDFVGLLHHTGEDRDDPQYVAQFHAYYNNMHASDPGSWLQGYCEPDATPADYATLGWDTIPGLWVWTPPNTASPVGTAPTVTNATLALIAAGKMTIPPTAVSISPGHADPAQPGQADPTVPGTSFVNLPTWLWLDPKQFGTQSVTVQLPQFKLSATVTAVPQELDVTVDGARFSTTGAGGSSASELVCQAKPDGSIGTPYTPAAGAGSASDCSITFLGPSPQNSSFTLHAKVVWKLTWTAGTAAAGWPKTEYLVEDVPNVVVKEIQSINSGTSG